MALGGDWMGVGDLRTIRFLACCGGGFREKQGLFFFFFSFFLLLLFYPPVFWEGGDKKDGAMDGPARVAEKKK